MTRFIDISAAITAHAGNDKVQSEPEIMYGKHEQSAACANGR